MNACFDDGGADEDGAAVVTDPCPALSLRDEVATKDAGWWDGSDVESSGGGGATTTQPHASIPPASPYDVVIMDVAASGLLHALLTAAEEEASRVVFVGWPGGQCLDAPRGGNRGREPLPSSSPPTTTTHGSALPPVPLPPSLGGDGRAVAPREVVGPSSSGGRRLAYAVLTRPVRQARLWVALEEVLASRVGVAGEEESGCVDVPPPLPGHHRASRSIDLASTAQVARVASGGSLHRAPSKRAGPSPPPEPASGSGSGGGGTSLAAAAAAALSPAPSSSPPPSSASPSLRILLAEDNLINMKVAVGVLARVGHTDVTVAPDGAAALDAIEAAGGPDAFDVILMDLHMPRMGGLAAVAELRERWPDAKVRVVAVTADAYDDTRDACTAAGFDGWLAKPFRVEDLAAVLEKEDGAGV